MAGAASHLQDAWTRLAPFYMLCPFAAFVTDSAYFSVGIQLSRFPYPLGQEDRLTGVLQCVFFSTPQITTARLDLRSSSGTLHSSYLGRDVTFRVSVVRKFSQQSKVWFDCRLLFRIAMPYAGILWPRTFLCGKGAAISDHFRAEAMETTTQSTIYISIFTSARQGFRTLRKVLPHATAI